MKLTNKTANKHVHFNNIKFGKFFTYENDLWLKVETFDANGKATSGAVSISNTEYYRCVQQAKFMDKCTPVEVEEVIFSNS